MKFKFKNKEYQFPTSLSQITLGNRVEFNSLYGVEINQRLKELENMDADDADLERVEIYLDSAYKSFSFFSGIPLDEAKNIPTNQVLNVYENCMKGLLEQQEDIDLMQQILWNDEFWHLESPELNYNSDINFNQFITSKQIVKSMSDLGKGYWDSLPMLCAVFLKKKEEVFDEAWLDPNSDRAKMMLELPLDIALQVAFFLRSSMSLSLNNSAFLEAEVEKDQI